MRHGLTPLPQCYLSMYLPHGPCSRRLCSSKILQLGMLAWPCRPSSNFLMLQAHELPVVNCTLGPMQVGMKSWGRRRRG